LGCTLRQFNQMNPPMVDSASLKSNLRAPVIISF